MVLAYIANGGRQSSIPPLADLYNPISALCAAREPFAGFQ